MAELLVDLHLKLDSDETFFTMEERHNTTVEFVERCMEELNSKMENVDSKKSVINLICLFLDRFEGIRPIKAENPLAAKFPQLKPI